MTWMSAHNEFESARTALDNASDAVNAIRAAAPRTRALEDALRKRHDTATHFMNKAEAWAYAFEGNVIERTKNWKSLFGALEVFLAHLDDYESARARMFENLLPFRPDAEGYRRTQELLGAFAGEDQLGRLIRGCRRHGIPLHGFRGTHPRLCDQLELEKMTSSSPQPERPADEPAWPALYAKIVNASGAAETPGSPTTVTASGSHGSDESREIDRRAGSDQPRKQALPAAPSQAEHTASATPDRRPSTQAQATSSATGAGGAIAANTDVIAPAGGKGHAREPAGTKGVSRNIPGAKTRSDGASPSAKNVVAGVVIAAGVLFVGYTLTAWPVMGADDCLTAEDARTLNLCFYLGLTGMGIGCGVLLFGAQAVWQRVTGWIGSAGGFVAAAGLVLNFAGGTGSFVQPKSVRCQSTPAQERVPRAPARVEGAAADGPIAQPPVAHHACEGNWWLDREDGTDEYVEVASDGTATWRVDDRPPVAITIGRPPPIGVPILNCDHGRIVEGETRWHRNETDSRTTPQ